jgi:hypothetical protein
MGMVAVFSAVPDGRPDGRGSRGAGAADAGGDADHVRGAPGAAVLSPVFAKSAGYEASSDSNCNGKKQY